MMETGKNKSKEIADTLLTICFLIFFRCQGVQDHTQDSYFTVGYEMYFHNFVLYMLISKH